MIKLRGDLFACFAVLSKLVTSLKEAESLSSEQELSFLQNLLESKEINALVHVHSKVAKVVKDEKCAPIMSTSMQVSFTMTVSRYQIATSKTKTKKKKNSFIYDE